MTANQIATILRDKGFIVIRVVGNVVTVDLKREVSLMEIDLALNHQANTMSLHKCTDGSTVIIIEGMEA